MLGFRQNIGFSKARGYLFCVFQCLDGLFSFENESGRKKMSKYNEQKKKGNARKYLTNPRVRKFS